MSERFDVVIVGAGPAGSLAALILSRAGKKVALLDKARFPRIKVCGDCVNPRCWNIWERHQLTEGFNQLSHQVVSGFTLELYGKPIFTRSLGTSERAVERELLDDWLCREAEKSGATFFPETLVTAVDPAGHLTTSQGSFSGKFILGADGRNSFIARSLQLNGTAQKCHRIAWQTNIDAALLDHHVHMNVFDEGYYGLTRVSPTTANLCMVLRNEGVGSPQQIAHRFFPQLTAHSWRSIYPITRSPARLGRQNVWLAGDAARVVEPFTGEGIYFALASGEEAANAILKGLESKNSALAFKEYQSRYRKLYLNRARVNSLIGWCTRNPHRGAKLLKFFQRWPSVISFLLNRVQMDSSIFVDQPSEISSSVS